MEFHPSAAPWPQLTPEDDAIFTKLKIMRPHVYRAPEGTLNIWRGFNVKAIPGSCSRFKYHLEFVICQGNREHYDYVLNWCAFAVQHPELAAEVALVFRGEKGCGKGIFFRTIVHLFGAQRHGMQITSSTHLVGHFNAHLRDLVVLFADEAFFAGDVKSEGVLKGLITEPHLTIEAKYHDAKNTPNRLHVMMATNKEWVVPATKDERRWFILDVPSTYVGDAAYFAAMQEQLDNGGYEALLYELQLRALRDFHPRRMPKSDALHDQIQHSLKPEAKWWADVLHRGGIGVPHDGVGLTPARLDQGVLVPPELDGFNWPDEGKFTSSLLYAADLDYCAKHKVQRPLNEITLGRFLGTLRQDECRISVQNKGRFRGHEFGAIAVARQTFNEEMGLRIDWPVEAGEAGCREKGGRAAPK